MRRILLKKFEGLSIHGQVWTIVILALAGADAMTFVFYGLIFRERLVLDLILTTLIVVVVTWPLAFFFVDQQAKLKAVSEKLRWAAHFDDLTALLNRRTFIEKAVAEIDAADADESAGALLYIDADRFKTINDTFGHAAGDKVLTTIAIAIRSCVREGDLAGRLGGEEFAVFLVHADRELAWNVAERIRRSVRDATRASGPGGCEVTVSVGLALHCPGQSIDEALNQADRFLYFAKRNGRDQVVDKNVPHKAA